MSEKSQKNGLGKRKRAIARVYLSKGQGAILVNGIDYKTYFTEMYLQNKVEAPLKAINELGMYSININASGGGVKGQAEAASLGIARAIVEMNAELKPLLRSKGLMTRDARAVERKKFGQKKARKRFQFTKR